MVGGRDVRELDFSQIKRRKLSDQAMESILDLIRKGVFHPGDKLPTQQELVARMGISQTAIRDALRGLVGSGIVDLQAGRGAFIRSVAPEMLINPESMFFVLERETLLHSLEVRKALEVEAIALATERATPEDLAEMERILRRIERGVKLKDRPFQHSPYFHLAIAQATHNPVFVSILKSFVNLLKRGAVLGEFVPEAREREYRLHAELYESIRKRDAGEAQERMRSHLQVSKEHTLRGFTALSCTGPPQERANS
jgi:GntR family transcriptional repressor for pyruvate dehydrogenase complex